MSNRFSNPFPQFTNSTPTVYSGGLLYFYITGTTTPLDTFSVQALTPGLENANPVVLNSAGRPAVDIWMKDQDYKVVLKDASGNTIWSADPVRSRDSTFIAKTITGSGSPTGVVAGTAGSSSVLPDFYWDYTNLYLYVCTTTGVAATAVWTGINTSSVTAVVTPPQGYLTPTSDTPVIITGVTSGTALYYTPDKGNLVPIWNGSAFIPTTFTELTLTMNAAHIASNIYDVYVFSNSGVLTLCTGPSWSAGTSGSITAGSCARGTGVGGAVLTRVVGTYTNGVQITGRNGATTYTVAAGYGTYLGSIFMDGTNGQITCHRGWGQSRKWAVWNAYNRKHLYLQVGDSTASWSYTSATVRASRNDSANSLTLFAGLADEFFDLTALQKVDAGGGTSGAGCTMSIGFGWNVANAFTGMQGTLRSAPNAGAIILDGTIVASHSAVPSLGINTVTMCESTSAFGAAATASYYGTDSYMLFSAKWLG